MRRMDTREHVAREGNARICNARTCAIWVCRKRHAKGQSAGDHPRRRLARSPLNQAVMIERDYDAVFIDGRGDKVGMLLGGIDGVAHGSRHIDFVQK